MVVAAVVVVVAGAAMVVSGSSVAAMLEAGFVVGRGCGGFRVAAASVVAVAAAAGSVAGDTMTGGTMTGGTVVIMGTVPAAHRGERAAARAKSHDLTAVLTKDYAKLRSASRWLRVLGRLRGHLRPIPTTAGRCPLCPKATGLPGSFEQQRHLAAPATVGMAGVVGITSSTMPMPVVPSHLDQATLLHHQLGTRG